MDINEDGVIVIESAPETYTEYQVIKIKNERINASGEKEYLVVYQHKVKVNGRIEYKTGEEWWKASDIGETTFNNYQEIKKVNNIIRENSRNTGKPIQSKKALAYTRESPKTKTAEKIKSYNSRLHDVINPGSTGSAGDSEEYNSGGAPAPPKNTVATNHTIMENLSYSIINSPSIEHQKQRIFEYCIKNYILLEYIGDDFRVSGRNMKNLNNELGFFSKHLQNDKNCIIVYRVDRLSRNTSKGLRFLEEMSDKNIDVHFVFENKVFNKQILSQDKTFIITTLAKAEEESDRISERVRASFKSRQKTGRLIKRPGFGYCIVNKAGKKVKVRSRGEMNIKSIIKKKYKSLSHMQYKKEKIDAIYNHLIINSLKRDNSKPISVCLIRKIINEYEKEDKAHVHSMEQITSKLCKASIGNGSFNSPIIIDD